VRRLLELLRAEGYQGADDSVQRRVRAWGQAPSQQGVVFVAAVVRAGRGPSVRPGRRLADIAGAIIIY